MTLDAVLTELSEYLAPGGPKSLLRSSTPQGDRTAGDVAPASRRYRLFLDATQPALRASRDVTPGAEPWVGTLLEARILSVEGDDGAGGARKTKGVLRLSFLCASWFRYRVRLKVRRNDRDVDADGDRDINARFIMESGASAWADNGLFHPRRDASVRAQLPPDLLFLTPDPASTTKQQWVDAPASAVLSLGDPLGTTMDRHPEHWLLRQSREGAAFPGRPGHVVAVEHVMPLVERYPVGERARGELEKRNAYETRLLGSAPAAAYASLFALQKSRMPSVARSFTVTWFADTDKRHPVLTVDRWPLGWPRPRR